MEFNHIQTPVREFTFQQLQTILLVNDFKWDLNLLFHTVACEAYLPPKNHKAVVLKQYSLRGESEQSVVELKAM